MSWDKRSTVRRPGPSPRRDKGMYVVYLGQRDTPPPAGAPLQVGDAFRLLPGAALCVGKSSVCEITLDAADVEDAHALITFMPGGVRLVLVDLGSGDGTSVAGRRAPVQLLEAGAEFMVAGRYRFRCQPAG